MIEFSLSKLNMLIFVTAVAAIVIFFIAAVNSNMRTRQSYELVYRIGKELKTGIESNSYCTAKFITLPKTVKTNSGTADVFNIKYKLNISAYNSLEDTKKIVLTIIDRKIFKPKIYAAYSFDYNGNIQLYASSGCAIGMPCEFVSDINKSADYDPSKVNSIDTQLLFAKTINNGISTVYVIPCLKRNGIYSCREFILQEDTSGISIKDAIPCLSSVDQGKLTTIETTS